MAWYLYPDLTQQMQASLGMVKEFPLAEEDPKKLETEGYLFTDCIVLTSPCSPISHDPSPTHLVAVFCEGKLGFVFPGSPQPSFEPWILLLSIL